MNATQLRIASSLVALGASTTIARAQPPEEPPAPSVTAGAYVETYYQLNFRRPSNRITNLRGYDNRDRTFTIENAALDLKGERGPLAVRVIAQVGSTGSTYYLAEPGLPGAGAGASATSSELWKYLQTATLAYKAPGEITIEAGLFTSPIGPEVLPIKDNWNWSRSTLFFGLPAYHTGARVSRPLGGGWTGTVAVYSGWNSVVDGNEYPSVSASALYTTPAVTAQVLYFGGIERPTGAAEGRAWRHLADAYAQIAVTDQTSILAHADAGFEPNDFGTSGWAGGALAVKQQLGKHVYAAIRGDYMREWIADDGGPASAIFFGTDWIASGTATLALQPVDGLSVRLEYRHDRADDELFFGDDVAGDGTSADPYVPNRDVQDTLTLGAVAWF